MKTETAFSVLLSAQENDDGIKPRGYKTALETLVSEGVRLSTGQERGFDLAFVKPVLSYMVFSPNNMDEWFEIEPEEASAKSAIRRAQESGLKVVPYFYGGYNTGDDTAGIKLDEVSPYYDLLLALHEKRHSGRLSGGLNHTRLGRAYYKEGKRARASSHISEAGQIQEAACDYSAAYDLTVLARASGDSKVSEGLLGIAKADRGGSKKLKRIIEARRSALLSGNEKAARIALARFGVEASETASAGRLYWELAERIRENRDTSAIEGRIKREMYPEKELSGYCLEDLLAARILHYADYQNDSVETAVGKLHGEFSPDARKVARGLLKNPFIDLIGLHESAGEVEESLDFIAYARRRSESRLLSELGRGISIFARKRAREEKAYRALRMMYALSEAAVEKGFSLSGPLWDLAVREIPKERSFEARRFVYLYEGKSV